MTQPPRMAERVLESLGADDALRDLVLGDLHEEFAMRVQSDGARSACRWYFAETIRTIPAFLRSWMRGARPRDFTRLVGIAVTSYTYLVLIGAAFLAIVFVFGALLQLPVLDIQHSLRSGNQWVFVVDVPLIVLAATLGGYIAGWIDRRTPLVSALSFGLIWATVQISVPMITGIGPFWYRVLAPIILVVGAFAGGVIRVSTTSADVGAVE